MVKHYIIMSSSYTDGTRVALDITYPTGAEVNAVISEIKEKCGKDVSLSTHLIETSSCSFESVAAYDPFFEDVVRVKTVGEFCEKIKKDRVLSGMDVATYILSKVKCTHLSLEKLVYFAYADYLCERSERLFEDKIYAFAYGPVIDSVYKAYKRSGYQHLEVDIHTGVGEMPARSRILFAKDGIEKLKSIDKTIEKYSGYTAGQLVDITHREGSPWFMIDITHDFQEIPDELIKAHHYVERV